MPECANCDTEMEASARFCPECGHENKDQSAADPSAPVVATIGGMETLADMPTVEDKNAQARSDLEVGIEFAGRYIIEAVIGRGGMGVVYRAEDKLTDKTVALKLIKPERAMGEVAIKRLIAEGTTSRDIRHKNVVAVYDVGEVDGQPFISMEYINHHSLRAWHREQALKRETIPTRVAARIIMEILDGLAAAHDEGIVHRDLKPENIILVGEPTKKSAPLKILDFGIASVAGNRESSTGTGMGTIGYMAPEQRTNPAAATASADLYSISVMFYELLMEVQPAGHWQPPSNGRSDVPLGIDQLIETGLSNHPASRPQTAAAYRQAIIDAINNNIRAKGKTGTAREQKSRSPAVKWAVGGTAAILGLILIDTVIPDDMPTGNQSTGEIVYGGNTVAPPPRTTPKNPYRDLSGTWYFDDGSSRSVQVSSNGGFTYDWPDQRVSGQFRGNQGQFTQVLLNGGGGLAGEMLRVDECHIDFTLYYPNGTIASAGRIHVNHVSGAPCP